MKALRLLILMLLCALMFSTSRTHAQTSPRVDVATVDGPIVTTIADYLQRAITTAEREGASAIVVQLNTPGGDVSTTLRIIQIFGESHVPVIVYVWPRRGEAFSAGTLITLAGHVAAMSPETSIGAAKPISSSGENIASDSRDKAVNALRATVRSITSQRAPKATQWAEQTITDAVAATADEALKLGAIDLIASDLNDLLKQIDGRTVMLRGKETKLQTANATIVRAELTLGEQLLLILISPNIAAILLFIAINGLLIEWQAPGTGVGGIVGAIAFILFLYAVGTLPVNLTGLVFIGLAVVLLIFDLTATQHGILTAGGLASFVIGAVVLFEPSYVPLSLGLVGGMALVMGALFLFVFGKAAQARNLKPTMGVQGLIGQTAVARTDLKPSGYVFVEGERWDATVESGEVHAGEAVTVMAVEGLKLKVRKAG
jgi:membrane-bound serine protease (ClpP class)